MRHGSMGAKLTATAFDLESAYKQLVLHPSECDHSRDMAAWS